MAASSLQNATGLPATFNSIGERRVLRAEHYEDVRGVVPWVREFPRPRAAGDGCAASILQSWI